jgi:DNA repair ATPase RecN
VHQDSTATLQRLAARLTLPLPQQQQEANLEAPPSDTTAADSVLSSLKQRQAGPGAAVAAPLDRFVQQSRDTQRLVQREIEQLQAACDRVAESRTRLSQLREMSNPYSAAVQQLQRQLEAQQQELDTRQQQQGELEGKVCGSRCLL